MSSTLMRNAYKCRFFLSISQHSLQFCIILNSSQYMIILFVLFLLQFSLACACLAVNGEQKDQLAEHGWANSANYTRADVQGEFDCCGFRDVNLPPNERLGHPICLNVSWLSLFFFFGGIVGPLPPFPCSFCGCWMQTLS